MDSRLFAEVTNDVDPLPKDRSTRPPRRYDPNALGKRLTEIDVAGQRDIGTRFLSSKAAQPNYQRAAPTRWAMTHAPSVALHQAGEQASSCREP